MRLNLLMCLALGLQFAWSFEANAALTPGYTVISTPHTDVGVAYEDGEWDLHIHNEQDDVEYEPDEAMLYVSPAAQNLQPVGSQWNFLGAEEGNSVWVLPEVEDPNVLWLGLGGEELESGIFVNDLVTFTLIDVRGPGQFSLWQTDEFGEPIVGMSSFDGIDSGDSVLVTAGGHSHYNWGFTAAGYYEIDFEAFGILADGEVFTSSGPVTYYFGVETTAVPEASSLALLGLAAAGGLLWKRRRSAR